MVEFINKLTESQASDRVHKVLRSDPDKKRDQEPNEESEFDKKDEKEEPHDELIIAGTDKELDAEETTATKPEVQKLPDNKTKHEPNKNEDRREDGHIDVTA
jgi:hypothetical protein